MAEEEKKETEETKKDVSAEASTKDEKKEPSVAKAKEGKEKKS